MVTETEAPVVMVVDDDAGVRGAVKRLLKGAGYQVKVFESTREVLANGRPRGACCMVLDMMLAGEDGLAFHEQMGRSGVRVPVVFISGYGDIPTTVRAIKSGAIDFLPKPFEAEKLLAAVAAAVAWDERSLAEQQTTRAVRESYAGLTEREREVFAAVTSGLLNKQIADELGIAEKTVKVHRARVMEKMAAETLADLVRMADILGVRWEVGGAAFEPMGSGFSAQQEQLAIAAARTHGGVG